MKIIKIIFTLFVVVLFFTTCKKYPEGGYAWRTKKNIIGNWTLALYEVDGIDSTDLINYNGTDDYKEVSVYKNASSYEFKLNNLAPDRISFSNKKEIQIQSPIYFIGIKCITDLSVNYCYRKYFTPEGPVMANWKILKLTKKELILSQSENKSYKLKFIRK